MHKPESISLLLGALLTLTAQASEPDLSNGEAAATQHFIKTAMQAYFNPPSNTVRIPYKALDGWIQERFTLQDNLPMEKLTYAFADSERVVLQCHGGGYVLVLNDSYRRFAQRQAQALQARSIYLFDYRHAPEYTHPQALTDAVAAYRQVLSEGVASENLWLVGDSAGGNLALSLCVRLKELGLPQPKGLILISPWTSMLPLPSHTDNARRDYVLGENTPLYQQILRSSYAAGHDPAQPELSPLYADLSGLPPLLIITGGYELLLSDSELLAQAAQRHQLQVTLSVYKGMPHDFMLVLPDLPQSEAAFEEMKSFVAR